MKYADEGIRKLGYGSLHLLLTTRKASLENKNSRLAFVPLLTKTSHDVTMISDQICEGKQSHEEEKYT